MGICWISLTGLKNARYNDKKSTQHFKCLYIFIAYILVFILAHIMWLLANVAS
jgi:hypothetical protein